MDSLTAEHRSKQLLVRRQTISEVQAVMPLLRWTDLDGSFGSLSRAVESIVKRNLTTSAGLSASYIRRLRVKRGPGGRVDISRPQLNPEQFAASLRVNSLVSVKSAAGRGLSQEAAMGNAAAATANAMTRLVLNGGRETVLAVIRKDDARYARVLGGEGCAFCQMLAGRGAIYSADTADFEAHDKCACTPEPDWG